MMRRALLAVTVLLCVTCSDDTDVIRERGGTYRIVDIDVDSCAANGCVDTIVVQLVDTRTGDAFQLSGDGNDGEKLLERLLEVLPCVEHPEARDTIESAPCG